MLLNGEQLGDADVTTAIRSAFASARVIWEDGVEELISGEATAWTSRAVQVRFGVPPHQHEIWVWAGAVRRA
jgi:hypothetical protein